MQAYWASVRAYRREWLPPLLVLLGLMLASSLPFWLTDLDTSAAALFYHPEQPADPWPVAHEPLWALLYQAAPVISGVLLLGGLGVIIAAGLWPHLKRLRLYAVFVILSAVVGPGLVVNALFKDNWGRPRPHHTEALGGTTAYLPPLALGERGEGKSFPCGHSSVGFILAAFWFIWRRHRPWLARLALFAALVLGTLLGIGRMAGGDHFLSDVLWSAWLSLLSAWLVYYFVLRIPWREDHPRPAQKPAKPRPLFRGLAYGGSGAAMLGGVLLATPVKQDAQWQLDGPAPQQFLLQADDANVKLHFSDGVAGWGRLTVKGRGFGLPGNRVEAVIEDAGETRTYRLSHAGIYTERDTTITLTLKPEAVQRLTVKIGEGDIRVLDAPVRLPQLTLETGKGEVQRP